MPVTREGCRQLNGLRPGLPFVVGDDREGVVAPAVLAQQKNQAPTIRGANAARLTEMRRGMGSYGTRRAPGEAAVAGANLKDVESGPLTCTPKEPAIVMKPGKVVTVTEALQRTHGDNLVRADCAYPGVEVLPDGTIVSTTYGHWSEGESPYVVCVRFQVEELDAQLEAGTGQR